MNIMLKKVYPRLAPKNGFEHLFWAKNEENIVVF